MLTHIHNVRSPWCTKAFCCVPPSPNLVLELYARWKGLMESKQLPANLKFENYYYIWSSSRRGENHLGMDDGYIRPGLPSDAQFIERPPRQLKGVIKTLVLLVDFPDRKHSTQRPPSFYEQMLFGSLDVYPAGSMADYYRRISGYDKSEGSQGIDIQGKVFGWMTLPQPSTYYTNGATGTGTYPQNAQGMAEAAINEALKAGVDFSAEYDALGEHMVTALFIIHAGSGAEQTNNPDDFWSLKWVIPKPIEVNKAAKLRAQTFLTVPEDCQMGVCAHEWGHLAARWADFYDTGRVPQARSNGLGDYCLMASGSWNNGGLTPGLPNGMLRMFHKWIEPIEINSSEKGIELKPAAEGGSIVMIRNEARMPKQSQYIFVEYRRRKGQDAYLPDEGIAIYSVDETIDNVNDESRLAIELIQADGKRDMAKIFGRGNRGDEGDLYPDINLKGEITNNSVGKDTKPPLSYREGNELIWTGITITVHGKPGDSAMTIDVEID